MEVFQDLFGVPGEKFPGFIRWKRFVGAMVAAGFEYEQLKGSTWKFTPLQALALGSAISFHEPHPDGKILEGKARDIARDLRRIYGFGLETFVAA